MVPGWGTALNGLGLFGNKGPKYLSLALAASGVICLALAFLLVISLRVPADRSGGENDMGAPDEFASEGVAVYDEDSEAPFWVVYVTGAVMRPGVYEIPAGSRVNDAVRMAGGLLRQADEEAVNLAEAAADGLHISVPDKMAAPIPGEAAAGLPQGAPPRRPASGVKPATDASARRESAAGKPKMPKEPKKREVSEKVNINEATAEELRRLPGIGAVLSGAIIAYRDANGPFTEVEELTRVKGIGRKRFESVRDFVTVSR
jgi:competence protein ComEA